MAAANNAEWCELVCGTHGAQTRFDEDAWTSQTRTPPGYPDAVTLVPDPSIPDLLARIDTAVGCSIKDSFASLDMTAYGFRVLFDAQWIVHRATAVPPSVDGARWEVVCDRAGLAAWERAWRGTNGPPGVFRPELFDHDSVSVLAARAGGDVVAGAVLNRSSTVIGISNFFTRDPGGAASWSGCLALAASSFRDPPSSATNQAKRLLRREPMASTPWVSYGCGSRKTERSCRSPSLAVRGPSVLGR
jgi:hypothetical protein